MEEANALLVKHLIGKPIKDIELYNVNENYPVFDPEALLVVDAGIQITFEDSVFSFGWDGENDGFSYSIENGISHIIGDTPYYHIDAKQISRIKNLLYNHIEEASIKWDYYQDYDENGELKSEKTYVPVDLLLRFSNGTKLHLAVIDYNIKKDPFEIIDAKYSLFGELLVNLGPEMEIGSEMDE